MTEQHPLTDRDVAQYVIKEIRIAYDKGSNDMLDRAVKWIEDEIDGLILSCEGISSDRFVDSLKKEFIDDFKQAMRPQQQEKNS